MAEFFKRRNDTPGCPYVVDSLPVAACDDIRIRRCRELSPKKNTAKRFTAISSKWCYFYRLRAHLMAPRAGEVVELALAVGWEADATVL